MLAKKNQQIQTFYTLALKTTSHTTDRRAYF